MESIPLDDATTFEMLARGDSVGVFQLESEGMREALRQIRPTEFNDIVAIGALYRPGAMRFIPDYARGKRDPASVTYQDPRLRPITEETYGCCIYQEQLMEISKQLGGFSPAEADDLRKAVGKKKRDLMATMEGKFVEGCAASGTAPAVAKDLWSLMTAAADYSLQQVPRGLLRADLLPHRLPQGQLPGRVHGGGDLLGDVDQGQGPVLRQPLRGDGHRGAAARRQLLRPRLRGLAASRSGSGSTRSRTSGHAAVEAIIAAREPGGPFESIWDFCERVDCPGRQQARDRVPDQVRCARLDRATPAGGCSRSCPQAQASASKSQEDARRGQGSIFDLGGGPATDAAPPGGLGRTAPDPRARSSTSASCCALEKETLGHVPLGASARRGPRCAPGAGRLPARRRGREARTAPG